MSNNFNLLTEHLKSVILRNPNAYIVFQDGLEGYLFGDFVKTSPEEIKRRIINIGISEQNGVAVASGLAMGGKTVYLVFFAAFLINRALEQVKLDICYNNLNIKMFGINAGFSGMAVAGYSHITLGDIAIARTLPNLKIFSPSPVKSEFLKVLECADKLKTPCYVRMDYSGYPNLENEIDADAKNLFPIQKGENTVILTIGSTIKTALEFSAKVMNTCNYTPSVYTVPCLKPFDENGLKKLIQENSAIVTFEEHTFGGLGSVVSEVIAKQDKNIAFMPIFIKDKNYNTVIRTIDFSQEFFLEKSKIFEKFAKLIKQNSSDTIVYKFLGIPLLKKVKRKKLKKFKPAYKLYILNIRIL